MKIIYIGSGYVGACSAAVSAASGHEVLVFDIDKNKIEKLSSGDANIIQSCLFEEGLADLLIRNNERIKFTTEISDLKTMVDKVDAVFMCLPTPEKSDALGETDLSFYEKAAESIAPLLSGRNDGKQEKHLVIVNKSTVPIRMIDYTEELFLKHGLNNFGIVSNPEFLVEGKAIEGSLHPDRVVVGAKSEEDFTLMRQIYQRFYDSNTVKYVEVNPYEAACGKLLANYLLFNKIVNTFDVVGRTCESFPHVKYEEVRKVLSTDPRIGSWGLYDSLYAGGSCFIKDAGSLAHQLEKAGAEAGMVRKILEANEYQLSHFFSRAEVEANFKWSEKTVAVLGLAFKQDTNDIRNSGAILFLQMLLGSGVKEVRVFDPVAAEQCKKYFENNPLKNQIFYAENAREALKNTDVAVMCTDWPEFKALGKVFDEITKRPYLIMDGRRILQAEYESMVKKGFSILPVGGPFIS